MPHAFSYARIWLFEDFDGLIDFHSIYDILVAPCFKILLRLEAGYPALRCDRCHNLKQNIGHTHNTHTKRTTTQTNTRTKHTTKPLAII